LRSGSENLNHNQTVRIVRVALDGKHKAV